MKKMKQQLNQKTSHFIIRNINNGYRNLSAEIVFVFISSFTKLKLRVNYSDQSGSGGEFKLVVMWNVKNSREKNRSVNYNWSIWVNGIELNELLRRFYMKLERTRLVKCQQYIKYDDMSECWHQYLGKNKNASFDG